MANLPNYGESIIDFLARKGSIQIAYEIINGGARYTDVEDETGMSPSTISKRLKQGEHLGLWTTIAKRPGDGRSQQKYVPTKNGLRLFEVMVEMGLPRIYERFHVYREEYQQAENDLLEEVRDKVGDGEFPPPWEEPPEPTEEALESIQNLDIDQSLYDRFERSRVPDDEEYTFFDDEEE